MWTNNDDNNRVGDLVFLFEVCPQGRENRAVARSKPGRTNLSNERRITGWLGETNNTSTYALGVGRVTRLNASGDRARVRVLADQDLAEALEVLGHPDLLPPNA